jgi:response regulator RpfG family c-di-GMP phosphodiesterase/putative methionine-R-sulfoxide reductase with GAF domain
MNDIVHTLILEDDSGKSELLVSQLQGGGFTVDYLSVDNAETMLVALQQQTWDMILANYDRSGFNVIQALELLKERGQKIPLVIITEKPDEVEAVRSIKAGAEDYIARKDLHRLFEAINRLLHHPKEKEGEDGNEDVTKSYLPKYQELLNEKQFLDGVFSGIQDGLIVMDMDLTIRLANPTVSGWFPEAVPLVGKKCYEVFHQSGVACTSCPNLNTIHTGQTAQEIIPRKNKGGETIGWLEIYNFPFTNTTNGTIKGVIQYMRDITGRKKAEDESHRLTEKLKAIALSARQMSALLDVHLLSRQVVDSLHGITGCYSSNLFILQDEHLVLTAIRGVGIKNNLTLGLKLPVKDGIIAHVALTGQPMLVPDVSTEPRFLFWDGLPETRSELAVPIKSGDCVLGVLDMQDSHLQAFDLIDLEAMEIFADQLAVSIENARLFSKIEQRTRDLEMISRVSAALRVAADRKEMVRVILEQLINLLDVDSAALASIDPATGDTLIELARGSWEKFSSLRISSDELGKFPLPLTTSTYHNNDIHSDEQLTHADVKQGLQSIAGVPLIAQGVLIGGLWVGSRIPISEEEVSLLSSIGDMAANALHRTTLHEQTQGRLQRIAALQRIDLTIATSFDLNVTFNVLLNEIISLLGVDAADILVLNPYMHTLDYAAGHGFRLGSYKNLHLRLGHGCAGKVALERHPISIPDLSQAEGEDAIPQMAEELFTSYFGVPLIVKGQIKGVLEVFNRKILRPDEEWLNFLSTLGGQAAIAVDNHNLFENLQRSNVQLTLAYDATIEGWSRALDLRDEETEGHTQRVTNMTLRLCEAMGVNETERMQIRRGALLHDIGKMGIPDSILLKPGPLTKEEWVIMQKHPVYAYEFLSPVSFLRPALDIPYCHHERWDGTGYPRGIRGEQIPAAARVFALADVWDALASDRHYRPAWNEDDIICHIQSEVGRHFDPEVVELFLSLYRNGEFHRESPAKAVVLPVPLGSDPSA